MSTSTDLTPLQAIVPPEFHEALYEIASWLYLQLVDEGLGLPAERLAAVALRQAERLSFEMGGSSVYIAKGVSYRLTPRNREMCEKFRGDYKVLAREYKLSEQQVRNIVDGWQREQYMRRQADMFGREAEAPRAHEAPAKI